MGEPNSLGDVHFWIGCLAVLAGFTAFASRKGGTPHRMAGLLFVGTMTLLTGTGLWLSFAREILFTVFLSAIALHAFATGWATARASHRLGRWCNRAAPLFSGGIALGALGGGILAEATPEGVLNDLPPSAFYGVAGVSCVIMLLDLRFALSPQMPEQGRLTRHLWRMGFAFFLATGIFFFGNNHVLPEALRAPWILSAPVLAVVVWTVFYAVRTRSRGLF